MKRGREGVTAVQEDETPPRSKPKEAFGSALHCLQVAEKRKAAIEFVSTARPSDY